MTQAADDAIHMQLSVGRETHFKKNFTFKLQLASFLGVNRIRLESDFHRCGGRP